VLIDKINELVDAVNNINGLIELSENMANPETPSDGAPKVGAGGDDQRG